MARLVVRRDADDDIKIRNLEIHVDGKWRADIAYGKSFEAELEPGTHELRVTNRMKSVKAEFAVGEGETARFLGTNVLSKGLSALVGAFGVVAYHPTLKRIA